MSYDKMLTRVAEAICAAEFEGDPAISPFPRAAQERHRRMAAAAISIIDAEVEKLRGILIDRAVADYKRANNLT